MLKINLPKGLPNFKLRDSRVAQLLNDVADANVKQIFNDTKQGLDKDGKKFKPLKQATIRAKSKKGYRNPTKPLIGTGKMIGVHRTKKATSSSLSSVVSIPKNSQEIAEYHIAGAGNLPKRVFFGVGKPFEKVMDRFVKAKMKKLIRTIWKHRTK